MGRPLTINIPHALGKTEARRRIDGGFAVIQRQLTGSLMGMVSIQQKWEADQMQFESSAMGQMIRGRLTVLDDSIQMQLDLPELLAAVASRIAERLKSQTAKLLEKK